MAVVLVSSDLMAASRIEGAATRLGVPLQTVANFDLAAASMIDLAVDVLILDLAALRCDIAAGVQKLRGGELQPVRILAFGPHVQDRLLNSAIEAGCDEVFTRGRFFAQLDAILMRSGGEQASG